MKRIESLKNERVKKWKKLHTKRGREQQGLFLVEGEHLVEEALKSNWLVLTIITNTTISIPFSGEVIQVNDSVLKELSRTETPQGMIAVCRRNELCQPADLTGVYVVLDRIQDPGNLGTIIRTALAAGATAVVVGTGSVDVFNDKVIRSTQGAFFHIPVYEGGLEDWFNAFEQAKIPVLGTSLLEAIPYSEVEKTSQFALLLGNEGDGVGEEWLKRTSKNVYIPQNPKAESLNVAVASGILLYSLKSDLATKD